MNQKLKLLFSIIALALLLLVASVLYQGFSKEITPESLQNKSQEKEEVAPDFSVFDLDGKEVKRSDFLGKPLVINFWATWCPYCVDELPEFNEVYAEVKGDVAFLMVDVPDGERETVEKAAEFIAKKAYQFPVVYDTELDAVTKYGVRAFPTTIFIDPDGNVVTTQEGRISKELLQKNISLIKK